VNIAERNLARKDVKRGGRTTNRETGLAPSEP
jgi:hypothetical protein